MTDQGFAVEIIVGDRSLVLPIRADLVMQRQHIWERSLVFWRWRVALGGGR
jgi:hypothetical protein